MTKLFLYLLNNEPDGKILNKKEINNFKKFFYSFDKNIICLIMKKPILKKY